MRAATAFLAVIAVACGVVASERSAGSRDSQSVAILEEVFRYQLQQFVEKTRGAPGSTVCLGVAGDTGIVDPPDDLIARIARASGVLPESKCGSAGVHLSAGPVEWLSDKEVRVRGAFRRAPAGSVPLVYRVVQESDRWSCLGPIISYDPL